MDWNTMCDSAKLTHKAELSKFNTLYEMYPTEFNTDYYISCNVRKNEACFCLKKLNGYNKSPDDIISFSRYLNTNVRDDHDDKKMYKKNKFFTPLRLDKHENDDFIVFYIKVKYFNYPFMSSTQEREPLECNVCLELQTEYFKDNPFLCEHNDVCVSCNNKIFKTTNSCCICRALRKTTTYL
jgi:hypothetical protein